MKKDRLPICSGKDCGNDVTDKGQTHHNKDFLDGLKVAIDCKIPKNNGNRHDKPKPAQASDQFQATTNGHQISRNQRDIGKDEQARG